MYAASIICVKCNQVSRDSSIQESVQWSVVRGEIVDKRATLIKGVQVVREMTVPKIKSERGDYSSGLY